MEVTSTQSQTTRSFRRYLLNVKPQTILWDVDGVLVDCKKTVFELYKRAFYSYGKQVLTESVFDSCLWGRTWDTGWALLAECGYKQLRQVKSYKDQLTNTIKQYDIIPMGFDCLMASLNLSINVIVITGGAPEATWTKLAPIAGRLQQDAMVLCKQDKLDPETWDRLVEMVDPVTSLVIDDLDMPIYLADLAGFNTLKWRPEEWTL